MSPTSKDLIGLGLFAVLVIAVILGTIYLIQTGILGAVIAVIIAIAAILIIGFVIFYFIYGAYAVVKKRDTVHTEYSSSLSDIQEVDREMNRDDSNKP